MRLVAIAAGDSSLIHPALQERTPHVHLVALLPVGVIKTRREQRRAVVIEEAVSGAIALGDLRAASMALCAHVEFAFAPPFGAAHCIPGRRIELPADAAPLVERDGESFRRIGPLRLRPFDVGRAGPMAGLT